MEFTNFEDVIKFAIAREEDAIEAYGGMSEKAKSPGLKELMLELQEEEKNHKKLLVELTPQKIAALNPERVLDLKISDYLVEEPPGPDMNFQDLLIFAAKKEQSAVDLYTKLKNSSDDPDLQKLFDFMVEQEKAHKYKLEVEYEEHVLEED
jgi:rubrerythrin